jgi:PAS domain S-box-containing protein
MKHPPYDQQVEKAFERLRTLRIKTRTSAEPFWAEALEELSIALEELSVAGEELNHQNEELTASRLALENECRHYQDLFEFTPDGYLVTDLQGVIREANQAASRILGVRQNDLKGKPFLNFIADEDRKAFLNHLVQWDEGEIEPFKEWEVKIKPRKGRSFFAALTIGRKKDEKKKIKALRWSFRDITERKRTENEREIFLQILQIINSAESTRELIKPIVACLKNWSGFQAVGIRLREGDDFPYFETSGFPDQFLLMETSLCQVDERNELIRDSRSNPVLECMCGNILSGRFDPSKPFFTPFGSFWTNSTSDLLAITSETDRQARTRNRCHGEGYESVALIPLRFKGETFGLMQINDKRKQQLSPPGIFLLERLADTVALALAQRRTEETIKKKSEEKYRMVADFTYDWEYWLGENRTFLYCSPSCQRLTGYPPEDFLNDPGLLVDISHPEDRHLLEEHLERVRDLQEIDSFDYRIFTRAGQERWISHVCQPVTSAEGKPLGRRASNRDITDRKRMEIALLETEERLEAAIEQSNDGIAFIKKGVILYVNKKFLGIFGYDDFKEVVGRFSSITVHPHDREMVSRYAAIRETDRMVPNRYLFKGLRKDGGIVYIEVSVAPIIYSGETISMAILRDVTEGKQADEQIKATLEEKEVLLREIHHRVKNNLQVISSLLNLQADYVKDEMLATIFQDSQNRIKSMALIHEKLYQSPDLSSIDLTEYLQKLTSMLFRTYDISKGNIRLEVKAKDISMEVDKAVPCGLIVNELVSNALKHAFLPKKEGLIQIELVLKDNQYGLTVRDNGVGLPEGLEIPKTGSLGLQIVQVLVKQVHGRMKLERHGGTSFTIHFPR